MVDELSEYFSKDLIASDLRKDDIASISWKLLFARPTWVATPALEQI
jgi:hypothetical protein